MSLHPNTSGCVPFLVEKVRVHCAHERFYQTQATDKGNGVNVSEGVCRMHQRFTACAFVRLVPLLLKSGRLRRGTVPCIIVFHHPDHVRIFDGVSDGRQCATVG